MPGRRKQKAQVASRSSNEIRALMLQYFYDRNTNATSARGRKGFSIKISDIRKELKASHGLTQQEVVANLNYLISQGWIAEEQVEKSVPLPSGTVIPQATSYYKITAAGIDKIEGPGEFTMDKFKGVRIEATGQNIITVGDGNQVNARYGDVGQALAELRKEFVESKDSTRFSELPRKSGRRLHYLPLSCPKHRVQGRWAISLLASSSYRITRAFSLGRPISIMRS